MSSYRSKIKPKAKSKRSLLPLWLALAGLALLLAALWAIQGRTQPNANIEVSGAPRLKVETEKIDRGNIKMGTPVRDDIRVTNVGDQPLRFTEPPYVEVKEGC